MNDQRPTPATPNPNAGHASVAAAAVDPVRLFRIYWPWLAIAAVFGVAFGFGAYKLLQKVAPSWPARVTFEVKGKPEPNSVMPETATGSEDFERYIETQAAIMTSDRILTDVIKHGNRTANTQWIAQFQTAGATNVPDALKDLRDRVSAAPIPDTSLIRLTVNTSVRDDAFEIAQDIADYYLVDNRQQAGQDIEGVEEVVKKRLDVLREELSRKEIAIKTLLEQQELSTLVLNETDTYQQMEGVNNQLLFLQQQFTLVDDTFKDWDNRRRQGQGIVFPELVIQEARSSALAQRLQAGIVGLQAELDALLESVGENHRQVRVMKERIRAQQLAYNDQIQQSMVQIFEAEFQKLENQRRGIQASITEATTRLEQLKKELQDLQLVINDAQKLEAERQRLVDTIDDFDARLTELIVLKDRAERVRRIGAEPPDAMAFPPRLGTIAAGFLLVVGAVAAFIFIRELREQRIRSPQDVALVPRTPVLGVLADIALDPASPPRVETVLNDAPTSATAEAVRQLRTAVLRACAAAEHRTILFASGEGGSGTSSVVANLACAVAALDAKVLVIDANLRRPRQHEVFAIPEAPGLAQVLQGSATLADAAVPSAACKGVTVLPAGADRAANLDRLSTRAMSDLLEQARATFDLVLIDAPPATVSTEALSLANRCDASILVVRAYQEKRGLLARLRNQFADARAQFLGVVLNAAQPVAGGYLAENIKATHGYAGRTRKKKNAA